jgi:hypothetical protein
LQAESNFQNISQRRLTDCYSMSLAECLLWGVEKDLTLKLCLDKTER